MHPNMGDSILLITILMQALIFAALSSPTPSCSNLPFPEACGRLPASRGGLRRSHLLAALRRISIAAASAPASSNDNRTLATWSDCVTLFLDMSSRLRLTLSSSPGVDSQTWLSAALTDLETCRNGFLDFGYASKLSSSPFISYNVSKLISNSLAIDSGAYTTPPSPPTDKFPKWVSAADRKLLQSTISFAIADLVVAQDGSGNYRTINDAVAAVAGTRSGTGRFVIYVKAGVYAENVQIPSSLTNLMVVGDGIDATIVTGNKNVQDGSTTFKSATFAVDGDDFIARDITFENTAGPEKHQAVALRSSSDFSVFYRCGFKGYQDTLYVHSQRQFYRECDIYGTVDFIFGDAAVVLQKCNIYLRRPLTGQQNTVTAQGRTDANENTGISIHKSRIAAASDLLPVQGSVRSYLGRPWKLYSRTVFMKSSIDGLIAPAGWLEWNGNFALSTLYYGEYKNTGAGADTSKRVTWPGYRVIKNATEAGQFSVGSFITGNSWLPATGVPFTSGL